MKEQPLKQNPFEISTDELDRQFDLVIDQFKSRAVLEETRFMFGELRTIKKSQILPRMISYGLLTEHRILGGGQGYELTKFGYEVLRVGGWVQYNKDKIEHDKLIRKQIQSTIETNTFQKSILYLSFALSLGAFLLTLFTYLDNAEVSEIERARFEREQKEVPLPTVNPNVNLTLKRDTIVLIQPIKTKK